MLEENTIIDAGDEGIYVVDATADSSPTPSLANNNRILSNVIYDTRVHNSDRFVGLSIKGAHNVVKGNKVSTAHGRELKSINEDDGNRDLGNDVLRTPPSSPPWNAIPPGQTEEFPDRCRRPHFLESDQLYHLADPMETSNLAHTPEHARKLDDLKTILTEELQSQARPFGEFVPGPDSASVKKIEPFLEKLARLKVIKRGFHVSDADTPAPPTGTLSRKERKKQREKRNRLKKRISDGTNR